MPFAWLVLELVWPRALAATDARELYRLGLEAYDDRDYEGALARFEESYRTLPSPSSKLYVARCLRAVGRTDEAIRAYDEAAQLAQDRAAGEPKYALTFQHAMREVAVLRPPPLPKARFVAATWTAAGVGLVGFASFGIFGVMAHARYASLRSNCDPLPCDASEAGHAQSGRQYQTLANVSLAVGIAGSASALTLFVLGRPRHPWYGQLRFGLEGVRLSGEF